MNGTDALDDERRRFRDAVMGGDEVTCPICDRVAMLRDRTINIGMVTCLVAVYRESVRLHGVGTHWVDAVRVLESKNLLHLREEGKTRYLGLYQQGLGRRRAPGSGKVTAKGELFLWCADVVEQTARIYNRECHDTTGRRVHARDVVGNAAWAELMLGLVRPAHIDEDDVLPGQLGLWT